VTRLEGIIPVVMVPFGDDGAIDERGLRNVVRFELDGGVHGIGVNGFASEAYKLTDEERLRVAAVVADEVAGGVPLVIGIAPGSLEAALRQADALSPLAPASLMTLPPSTFGLGGHSLVEFYIELGRRTPAPVMVQQATHIHAYSASHLEAAELVAIADAAAAVTSFKIEGPRAPIRIAELATLLADRDIALFGGGGGITFLDELRAGASGLIPGVGFNERFVAAWDSWTAGDTELASTLAGELQPLVDAVSGPGHEFSIHARKRLLLRAGLISSAFVRRPTVVAEEESIEHVMSVAASIGVRLLAEVAP
jgi:4-hydroxy-tetrahydrodipicolinate synthase